MPSPFNRGWKMLSHSEERPRESSIILDLFHFFFPTNLSPCLVKSWSANLAIVLIIEKKKKKKTETSNTHYRE